MGIDVPEFLAELGMEKYSTELIKAVGDCAVIAFYYLLRVGEYTVKKHGIFQLEWHRLLCFISLFFNCIFFYL